MTKCDRDCWAFLQKWEPTGGFLHASCRLAGPDELLDWEINQDGRPDVLVTARHYLQRLAEEVRVFSEDPENPRA